MKYVTTLRIGGSEHTRGHRAFPVKSPDGRVVIRSSRLTTVFTITMIWELTFHIARWVQLCPMGCAMERGWQIGLAVGGGLPHNSPAARHLVESWANQRSIVEIVYRSGCSPNRINPFGRQNASADLLFLYHRTLASTVGGGDGRAA